MNNNHITASYRTFTGKIMDKHDCTIYNRLTDQIEEYRSNNRQPPETLLNERHKYFSICAGCYDKKGKYNE